MSAGCDHQWMVLWAARLMERDGFEIVAFHGPTPQGGLRNQLPIPPSMYGHRPDVCGRRQGDKAIGEAKSSLDVASTHSASQYQAYSRALEDGLYLYLVCPQSRASKMDRALISARLLHHPRVVRLHVPDALLMPRQ
jgi:hypothetical protein